MYDIEYYFDKNGSLSTGVKMIGKHYYYFRKGGQMDYGTYNSEGNYSGWHSYNGKKRYIRLSDDENYAYMDVGRKKIGSETYYFDKNGYKLIPYGFFFLIFIYLCLTHISFSPKSVDGSILHIFNRKSK